MDSPIVWVQLSYLRFAQLCQVWEGKSDTGVWLDIQHIENIVPSQNNEFFKNLWINVDFWTSFERFGRKLGW